MKELATLNDESMSATIGGLLEQVSPVLERVVTVLRAANLAKDAVKGRLVDDLEQAQARMERVSASPWTILAQWSSHSLICSRT